jgi:hypothetical protein
MKRVPCVVHNALPREYNILVTPSCELSGVSGSGQGQPPGIFLNPTENFRPAQIRKKLLPLHFWRMLDYISHIECTSFSRSKIVYISIDSLLLSKYAIDWDFIIKVKPSIKHVIDLEVKIYHKTITSTEVILFFVTYALRLSLSF